MKSLAYKQLESEISRRIQSGIYLPGAQLPTEQELVAEFHVSRMTVSKGLSSLIQSGTIERIRGRGTFVTLQESAQSAMDGSIPQFIRLLLPGEASKQQFRINSLLESISESCQYAHIQVGVSFYRNAKEATDLVKGNRDSQGLICWPVNDARFAEEINNLISMGQQVVLVDNLFHDYRGDFVGTDNYSGAETMVKHLYDTGHRKIAYLTFPSHASSLAERMAGVLGSCAQLGIPLSHDCLGILPPVSAKTLGSEDSVSETYLNQWLDRILNLKPAERPTAIFTSNDVIAIKLMTMLTEMGISIPQDMSLVSFDNIDRSAWLPVPLTTLAHDFQAIGTLAGQFMSSPNPHASLDTTRQYRVKPKLIIRDSLASPRS